MFSHFFLDKEKKNFQSSNNIKMMRKIRHKKIKDKKIRTISLTHNRHF